MPSLWLKKISVFKLLEVLILKSMFLYVLFVVLSVIDTLFAVLNTVHLATAADAFGGVYFVLSSSV